PVRPRVFSPLTGEALLLEDEIVDLIERGRRGIVWICGGPGSGKTTALAHLSAVLPTPAGVILWDSNEIHRADSEQRLVVWCSESKIAPERALAVYELAPWGRDETIEYLLNARRDRCESVMHRCGSSDEQEFLEGNPELWRHVIDLLAADEGVATVRAA